MATPTTLPATFVAGNVLTAAQMNDLRGAFRVLQVLQTVKTDTFSTTSTTWTALTGMSVTITPSATSSKILVLLDVKLDNVQSATDTQVRLKRASTAIYVGDAAGNRIQASMSRVGLNIVSSGGGIFLDSPSTTSATAYSVDIQTSNAAGAAVVNRRAADTDTTQFARYASSITVLEISA